MILEFNKNILKFSILEALLYCQTFYLFIYFAKLEEPFQDKKKHEQSLTRL